MDKSRQTHGVEMNYFDYYTTGYTCPSCGQWVTYNTPHNCSFSPQPVTYVSWHPSYNPILNEIKELLEKLIELLSKE